MDGDLLMIQPDELIPDQSNNYFAQFFWGEKNLGFSVLQQNLKHGQTSVKELQDYIRESANVEELYAKQMMKLAKQAAGCTQQGTFYPLMEIFKVMNEKVASCHNDIVLKLHDMIKDLQKYYDDQKTSFKKHKDTFNSTSDSLHNFQAATTSVIKHKEKYYQIKAEEDRLKAGGVAQKDLDRVATKLKKAGDEYRSYVGKHAVARLQFEEKMYLAANELQRLEREHLDHMKAVLDTYILSFENSQVLVSQVHQEFRRQLQERTTDVILRQYAEDKGTGADRPVAITFEESPSDHSNSVPAESIYENVGLGDNSNQNMSTAVTNKPKKESAGLFGIRRRKGKQKNGASVRSKDTPSVPSEKDDNYMVDEEGYTIRPETPDRSESTSFKYSSDSDSEDDDLTHRKFDVKIKPKDSISVDDGSNNVDVLTAITKNLTIGSPSLRTSALPLPESKRNRSSRSSPSTSSEKTSPQMTHYSFAEDFGSTYATVESTLGDLPSKSNDTVGLSNATAANILKPVTRKDMRVSIKKGPAPPIPLNGTAETLEPSVLIAENVNSILTGNAHSDEPPPRPPKPHSIDAEMLAISNNELSPKSGTLAYSESWSSLSSAEGSISTSTNDSQSVPSFASFSRGPSPLTLSTGDNIPIAVAFLETVHAYFKKGGPSNTLSKISGEVQISFPAGIIRAFTSTSNAPVLSFKICSNQFDRLQNLTHNKSVLNSTGSGTGHYDFSFDMPALIEHLKKQVDKNPHCPYYNIHIISYLVPSSHSSLPLYLSCSWKCDPTFTLIDIDYSHNSSATNSIIQSVNVIVPVDGSVTSNDSTPTATWNSSHNRLSWSIPDISITSPKGNLKSLLAVASGPSSPSAFAVQFVSEGSTLSGADFQLLGFGYRVSLIKRRFTSGKYLCGDLQAT